MSFAVPGFITAIVVFALLKKTPVYEGFSEGAKNGLSMLFNIFPPMLAIMTAVSMLRASGALEGLMSIAAPLVGKIGISSDVVLLGLVRPLSGSGALGVLTDILKNHGPDSLSGLTASVMMGSCETTFYTLTVYFSKTKVKYTKRAVPAAVFGDILGLFASIAVCKIFF